MNYDNQHHRLTTLDLLRVLQLMGLVSWRASRTAESVIYRDID